MWCFQASRTFTSLIYWRWNWVEIKTISLLCKMPKHCPRPTALQIKNNPISNQMEQAETLAWTSRSKVLCFAIPARLALRCPKLSKLVLLYMQDFPIKTLIFSWYRSPTSVFPLTFASQRALPFTHAAAGWSRIRPPDFLLKVSRILLMAKASVITHTKLPCLEARDLSFTLQLFQGF